MLGLEAPESVMPDTPAERIEREIGWGFRRYIEALAKSAPLIVVMDDLQWAEAPVVTILDQLVERVTDAPLLLICIARPEFLEHQRNWSSGKPNSTTITLDPLNPTDTATLISKLLEIEALPPGLRAQIIDRSAGTPLFCEEFIHMLIDDGSLVRVGTSWRATGAVEQIQVPQSINAVLSARLDGLPERERDALQAASVVGQRFEMRQLEELVGDGAIEDIVESLQRKGLVAGADGSTEELQFRHLLIRDAAYSSLPKLRRAGLHDRFGIELERQAGDPQQITEILAHHAERAFTLSTELGMSGEDLLSRASRAVDWSLAMADRARTRHEAQTLESALKTVRAASAMLPLGGGPEARARLRLLEAQLLVMKADYGPARAAAAEAATIAGQAGLLGLVATARLTEAWIYNWTGEGSTDEFARIFEQAVDACRKAGDMPAEIEARHLRTNVAFSTGRLTEFVEVNERLVEQARAIGDSAHEAQITVRLVAVEFIRGNADIAERHVAEAEALAVRYGLRNITLRLAFDRVTPLRLQGDIALSEQVCREYLVLAAEAEATQHQVSALRFLAYSLVEQGRLLEAIQTLEQALELSEASGESWNRSELLGLRARAALGLGDLDSADGFIERALSSLRTGDVTANSEVYDHLGLIRAAQGRSSEAEAAFRHSLGAVAATEYHQTRATAALDLAEFLAGAGRLDEARLLCDEYAELTDRLGWKAWAPQIATIRTLIEAKKPA